ncbi:hypothetical protein I316_02508 [Kwoniella heveanensis BCC8398]|uniref:Nucleolar 27S pre-rRNA processing Urb2/Npa2 C-terminal domain-containing protein n=1 Tax=Kwoniella heveanensis BCC8398 TaxID=1296120 RepID=A0A1B9GYC8_9TREE|nr:hypothetical protein I316_02508 [Kwoniella heveanensis BCC8398]
MPPPKAPTFLQLFFAGNLTQAISHQAQIVAADTMVEAPYLASASTLIKALRGAADPPQEGWPGKAEIALAAWRDTSFHVPRKEDVLRDWVLDSWTRGQGLLNTAYHDLLDEVAPASVIPLPILSSFFTAAKKQDISTVIPSACRSFRRPDPNAKSDAWVNVWISMLGYLSDSPDSAEQLVHLVTASMQAKYNPTNAKKSASTASASFPLYCKAYAHKIIRVDLNAILSLLIFHPTLPSPLPSLFASIEPTFPSTLSPFLAAIPDVFRSLVQYYHQQRYAIFTQASSSKVSLDVFIATKEREAVRATLEQTLGFLAKSQSDTTWDARAAVWAAIEGWGGYMERDERWGKLVHAEARTIESLLSRPSAPIGALLHTLSILERLDHDQTQIGPDVVRWCLASPATHHDIAETILSSLLRFAQLTHTLPTFFDLLVSSLDGLFDESLPEPAIASLYDLTIHGPVTRHRMRHEIVASLRSLQASKHFTILDLLSTRLRSLIAAPERPSKKRKRDEASDHASAMIGILTRILSYCLSATPLEDLQELLATWPEPASDIARAGRLRVARCIERLASRTILVDFTVSSGHPELEIETLRFLLHRGALNLASLKPNADSLLKLMEKATPDSPLWQILLAEGMILLDSVATPAQLDRLARLMRFPSTTVAWELPNFRDAIIRAVASGPNSAQLEALPPGYIDRKTRIQIVSQILANKQVVAFAPWLLQVADAETLGALSSDSKVLKHLAKSEALDLLSRVVTHTIKSDNVAVVEGIIPHLKSDTMIARLSEILMAHPVEKFVTLKPSLEKLYLAGKKPSSTDASPEEIVRFNTNVRFGRWLGLQIDSEMGDALLARVRDQPELAQIALETVASECDVEKILAACVHIYNTTSVDLSSTLRSIITDVPKAITLCLTILDGHASSVTRILVAIAPRSEDIALSRRAIQAVLAQPIDAALKISYIESLADEKPHALQHGDIAQLWAIALPVLDLGPILNILSTLTRRRPELILSTLPEVSDVLCAAFEFLQTPRSSVTVSNTSNAAAQAVSLARLFTAMTTMRTSKTQQTHETSPLAKYVPALLVAYVRAAAHPYKGLSPPVRRALEPGLHALCNLATAGGRVNARGREGEGLGTPFGLGEGPGGEGEKELWAELWRGWSKARYVGQG